MIVVLADDFSGAAEIAGVALMHGLSADVHLDHLRSTNCDVAVIDTNSRSCPPGLAARTVRHAALEAMQARPDWIYKKVDSVLRGPVLAEIDATCEALALPRCLLVNANPRKGRVVRAGELSIDGEPITETPFAVDPEHPCTSARVVEILAKSSTHLTTLSPGEALPATGCCVANAACPEDLHALAALIDSSTLAVGAAEFFEALLLSRLTLARSVRAAARLRVEPRTLVIRGTSMKATDLDGGPQTAADVCERLRYESPVTLSCGSASVARPPADAKSGAEGIEAEERWERVINCERAASADELHDQLLKIVQEVYDHCPPNQLWIEGGRTASSVLRSLGCQRLVADEFYADGVVGMHSAKDQSPTAKSLPLVASHIIVKPGSYTWPASDTTSTSRR